jgi:hypothetical protein
MSHAEVRLWTGFSICQKIYWTLHKANLSANYKFYQKKTNVLSHSLHCAAYQRLPTVDDPLFPCSLPRRLTAISYKPPTLLTAGWRLSLNGSWSSLYRLSIKRTENAAVLIVGVSIMAITLRLLSHCLTIGVFAKPIPSKGCFYRLHNSDFKHTYHININNHLSVAW